MVTLACTGKCKHCSEGEHTSLSGCIDADADTETLSPYEENPFDIRAISFSPNGDVLKDNIYQKNILDILSGYQP